MPYSANLRKTNTILDGLRKSRSGRYNLRSFSRRKAEGMKSNSTKKGLNETDQEASDAIDNKSLSNSRSCPELREEMTWTIIGSPSVEPKEPAFSLGLINVASDNFETDESAGEGSSSYERSISDSEINYYDLGECSGEHSANSGRWYVRCIGCFSWVWPSIQMLGFIMFSF